MEILIEIIKNLLLNAGGTVTAGAVIFAALSFLQVSKIQINPWDSIRRWIGGKFNAEQMADIAALKEEMKELRERFDEYIRLDNERAADEWRRKILTFNNQLLRDIPHTKEDFTEILGVIDEYEKYCAKHPGYKNNRAVHAIAHIGKVYDERQEKHDFLKG